MGDKWWAVLGLVGCSLVWAGMAAGPVRRSRWQAQALSLWRTLLQRLRSPAQARQARREAAEAIERARRAPPQVDREGNVYRPDAFKAKRGGRDKLH